MTRLPPKLAWPIAVLATAFLAAAGLVATVATPCVFSQSRTAPLSAATVFKRPLLMPGRIRIEAPRLAAMKMVRGPFFFRFFAGSWRFESVDAQHTRVIFRYSFDTRWPRLRRVLNARPGSRPIAVGLTQLDERLAELECLNRCRRRRVAHSDAASDLPLPADGAADRRRGRGHPPRRA